MASRRYWPVGLLLDVCLIQPAWAAFSYHPRAASGSGSPESPETRQSGESLPQQALRELGHAGQEEREIVPGVDFGQPQQRRQPAGRRHNAQLSFELSRRRFASDHTYLLAGRIGERVHGAGRHNQRFSWSEMAYGVPNPHA